MRFSDFWLLWKGFNDGLWYEHDLIRLQTGILYNELPNYSKSGKKSFNRVWRGKTDKVPTVSQARERLKKHREEEALRRWKNGTTTEDRG